MKSECPEEETVVESPRVGHCFHIFTESPSAWSSASECHLRKAQASWGLGQPCGPTKGSGLRIRCYLNPPLRLWAASSGFAKGGQTTPVGLSSQSKGTQAKHSRARPHPLTSAPLQLLHWPRPPQSPSHSHHFFQPMAT